MERGLKALVTPCILKWARELNQMTLEEVANKLKVNKDKLNSWELGVMHPTMNQAKDLANIYKIPFAYFYLPDNPHKVKRIKRIDFRTFGNKGTNILRSQELNRLLIDIEDRRDSMIYLYDLEQLKPKQLDFEFTLNSRVSDISLYMRDFLNLSSDKQRHFQNKREFLKYCINQLEARDILIFQSAQISPNEMRGLSLAYKFLPVIVLNRKDEPSARLFTLFHELVHLMTSTSGICNDMFFYARSNNKVEMYCNEVAGNALVPKNLLLSNENTKILEQEYEINQSYLNDRYVNLIARDFKVSREVIINRLWAVGVISQEVYFIALRRYTTEYLNKKGLVKEKGFLPPTKNKCSQMGRLYARTVLSAYNNDHISPIETSAYLMGIKMPKFRQVESWCF